MNKLVSKDHTMKYRAEAWVRARRANKSNYRIERYDELVKGFTRKLWGVYEK